MKNIYKSFDLKNKNIVITGACGLIGKEFVNAFKDVGSNIAIVDLPNKKPKEFSHKLTKLKSINGYTCDISHHEEIKNLLIEILSDFTSVDVLINAVQYKPEGFLSTDVEDFPLKLWNDIIRVNLTGTFLTSKVFGNQMIKQGKGSIINLASTYGVISSNPWLYNNNNMGNPIAYTASKGGVIMMTKYLATYWAKKNVRVNCLTPHGVFNDHEKEFIKRFSQLSPMGRMMEKEELVGAGMFLASDASSYVTGQNLMVDGGWTSW